MTSSPESLRPGMDGSGGHFTREFFLRLCVFEIVFTVYVLGLLYLTDLGLYRLLPEYVFSGDYGLDAIIFIPVAAIFVSWAQYKQWNSWRFYILGALAVYFPLVFFSSAMGVVLNTDGDAIGLYKQQFCEGSELFVCGPAFATTVFSKALRALPTVLTAPALGWFLIFYSGISRRQRAKNFFRDPALDNAPEVSDFTQSQSEKIDLTLIRNTLKEFPVIALAYTNLAVFSALLLASTGLNTVYAIAYMSLVTVMALTLTLIARLVSKNASDVAAKYILFEALILAEFALSSILIFDMVASERASFYVAVSVAAGISLLSVVLCARFMSVLLISKLSFILLCCLFVATANPDDGRLSEIISFIVITFMLMISIGSWLIWRGRMSTSLGLRLKSALDDTQAANDALQEARLLRQKMVRYIGHDLRQPLSASNYILLELSKNQMPHKTTHLIGDLRESLRSASRMIENIVQVSHYENPEIDEAPETFALNTLLSQIVREYDADAIKAGCQIRLVRTGLGLNFDPVLLTRILRNLIQNALIHSGASKLVIGVKRVGPIREIQVIDNGRGIKNKPAGPYQLKAGFMENDVRLGLGLDISRQLARGCGGDLKIRSEAEKGTLCRVILPANSLLKSS